MLTKFEINRTKYANTESENITVRLMQTLDYRNGPAYSSPYLQVFSQVSLLITAIKLTTLRVIVTEIGSTFTQQHRNLGTLTFFVLNHQIPNGSKVKEHV